MIAAGFLLVGIGFSLVAVAHVLPVIGASLFAWNPSGFWLICGLLAAAGAVLVLLSGRLRDASARPGS